MACWRLSPEQLPLGSTVRFPAQGRLAAQCVPSASGLSPSDRSDHAEICGAAVAHRECTRGGKQQVVSFRASNIIYGFGFLIRIGKFYTLYLRIQKPVNCIIKWRSQEGVGDVTALSMCTESSWLASRCPQAQASLCPFRKEQINSPKLEERRAPVLLVWVAKSPMPQARWPPTGETLLFKLCASQHGLPWLGVGSGKKPGPYKVAASLRWSSQLVLR